MEYNQITKSVIDFQKKSFDSLYDTMAQAQSQAISTMDMMLNQAAWMPEDGRSAIQSWMNVCQEERNRFKSYIDKGFTALEKAVGDIRKPSDKAKKPAAG